jgi:hypothetical protein
MRNAECGKKKRGKRYLNSELGMRNVENKKRRRAIGIQSEIRNPNSQIKSLCLLLSVFRRLSSVICPLPSVICPLVYEFIPKRNWYLDIC